MDLYVNAKSKGFPDASTTKQRTEPSRSELCFYQSFIPWCDKTRDCDLTLRDCCFASDRVKFLSERVANIQLRKCPKEFLILQLEARKS